MEQLAALKDWIFLNAASSQILLVFRFGGFPCIKYGSILVYFQSYPEDGFWAILWNIFRIFHWVGKNKKWFPSDHYGWYSQPIALRYLDITRQGSFQGVERTSLFCKWRRVKVNFVKQPISASLELEGVKLEKGFMSF